MKDANPDLADFTQNNIFAFNKVSANKMFQEGFGESVKEGLAQTTALTIKATAWTM